MDKEKKNIIIIVTATIFFILGAYLCLHVFSKPIMKIELVGEYNYPFPTKVKHYKITNSGNYRIGDFESNTRDYDFYPMEGSELNLDYEFEEDITLEEKEKLEQYASNIKELLNIEENPNDENDENDEFDGTYKFLGSLRIANNRYFVDLVEDGPIFSSPNFSIKSILYEYFPEKNEVEMIASFDDMFINKIYVE